MNLPATQLRTLLVLGRVSNLPTVWSNCLAAWLLGGGGPPARFALVCAGASLLYIGGMYLNDAFDTAFDQQHRRERPIPSGAIAARVVWQLGLLWLVLGVCCLLPLGWRTALPGCLLALAIVVYDAVHKLITFSPLLMALCRFLLYGVAASAAQFGITGLALWSGFALASYVAGVSYLARRESTGGGVPFWPVALLLPPVLLAMLVNDGPYRQHALLVSIIMLVWSARSLRPMFSAQRNVGRTIAGLLAGIVWVDLLAVASAPALYGAVFVGLFLLALLFQRLIPAT